MRRRRKDLATATTEIKGLTRSIAWTWAAAAAAEIKVLRRARHKRAPNRGEEGSEVTEEAEENHHSRDVEEERERPAGEGEVRQPHTPQLQATSIAGPEVAAWTLGADQNLHNRRLHAYQRSPPLPLGWHLILDLFVDPPLLRLKPSRCSMIFPQEKECSCAGIFLDQFIDRCSVSSNSDDIALGLKSGCVYNCRSHGCSTWAFDILQRCVTLC